MDIVTIFRGDDRIAAAISFGFIVRLSELLENHNRPIVDWDAAHQLRQQPNSPFFCLSRWSSPFSSLRNKPAKKITNINQDRAISSNGCLFLSSCLFFLFFYFVGGFFFDHCSCILYINTSSSLSTNLKKSRDRKDGGMGTLWNDIVKSRSNSRSLSASIVGLSVAALGVAYRELCLFDLDEISTQSQATFCYLTVRG